MRDKITLIDTAETSAALTYIEAIQDLVARAIEAGMEFYEDIGEGKTEDEAEQNVDAVYRHISKELTVILMSAAYLPQLKDDEKTPQNLDKLRDVVRDKMNELFLKGMLENSDENSSS